MQMPSLYAPDKITLDSGLYLVATPIGNLGDITLRALNVLASVQLIACEDTRVSAKLLNHYGIRTRMEAYHEHNAEHMRPKLLTALAHGESIALISDAGTPLISDPGYKLVVAAIEADIKIIPIPGASSVMAAMCVAGLPTDKFAFVGFLPTSAGDAKNTLLAFSHVPASLILFSTPSKIQGNLELCLNILGDRKMTMCRELTKLYEETWRGNISSLIEALKSGIEPRGEIVLVIAPPDAAPVVDESLIDEALLEHLARLPLKSAAMEVAAIYNIPKNKAYQRALELKKQP
jgi:16S rRNA (cytidine1402-2'-O)-methyltransferase